MNKEKARELAKQYRQELTDEEYLSLSTKITNRLCYVYQFKEAFKYHIFIGSEAKKEINTKPLIDVLINSGRAVYAPKIDDDFTMKTCPVFNLNDIKKGAFGIEEPKTEASTVSSFDAIVIPMLAADFNGGRIGYGKGFYDRFLKKSMGIKIGLVYDKCLFESIKTDNNDVPMDVIITELRIIDLREF